MGSFSWYKWTIAAFHYLGFSGVFRWCCQEMFFLFFSGAAGVCLGSLLGVKTPLCIRFVTDMKPDCSGVCWQVVLEGQRTFDFHAVPMCAYVSVCVCDREKATERCYRVRMKHVHVWQISVLCLLCLFTRACVCVCDTMCTACMCMCVCVLSHLPLHRTVMSFQMEAGVLAVMLSPSGPQRHTATLLANTHFDHHTTLCVFCSCEMMQH